MATVTTTFFLISDQGTDRSVSATWTRPQSSSSQSGSWKWVAAGK